MKADVLEKHGHAKRGIFVQIKFSDLQKSSVFGKNSHRRLQFLLGQRITRIGKEQPIVEATPEILSLLLRRNSGEHLTVKAERNADGCLSDSAGARVHQHRFSSFEIGAHTQGIVGGRIGDRDGGRVPQTPLMRHLPNITFVQNNLSGETARAHNAHALLSVSMTTKLHAEQIVLHLVIVWNSLGTQLAGGEHDVAKIERCIRHLANDVVSVCSDRLGRLDPAE
ncbi:hypothetical protein BpHYR1_003563 [Brachionus plicatilis]|uniref:Uncharacterized protein n=1 Tax=Brachionus plicatilis TaxID=10195 RepID=A0A3M7QDM1_BRAPC|nr:hypothetical protein BpHYR1_003563 [Brachionus plicatilis]